MIDAGASTRAIVECTGASKTTVNRMRSERPKKRPKSSDPPTHPRTCACDGSPTHATHATHATHVDPPTATMPESDNFAFKGMCNLIDPLLEQLNHCKSMTDDGKKAYAMTMYADKLIKIYSKIGTWTGLDDPAPAVIAESPIDSFLMEGFEVMKKAKEEVSDVGSR